MRKEQGTKWRAPKRREEEFKKGISILIDQKKPKDAEKLMKVITTTCGKVLTKTKTEEKIGGLYWWTEVAELRRKSIKKTKEKAANKRNSWNKIGRE